MKFRIHDSWGDKSVEAMGAQVEEYAYREDVGTRKHPNVVEKKDLGWFIDLDQNGLVELTKGHDVMILEATERGGGHPFIWLDKRGGRFHQR